MFSAVESSGRGEWMKKAVVQAVRVKAVCLIAVHRELREQGNQLDALAQHVRPGRIVRLLVVRVERENAAGKRVHHVARGRFHDDIAHKIRGQGAVIGEQLPELRKLIRIRQLAE